MQQSRYRPERFDPREGLSYGEWLDRRDQKARERLSGDFNNSYHQAAETLTRMAGIGYDPDNTDQKVEEALALLRSRNPLGGPWISLAQDYHRMRQAEAVLNG